MKSNPARELAEILESWMTDKDGMAVTTKRATALGAKAYDHVFWSGIDRAVGLLDEYRRIVDTVLDEREAEYHRSQFHALHALIYLPDTQWGTSNTKATGSGKQIITTLRLAAGSLDNLVPAEIHQSQGDEIVGHLQDALRLTIDLVPEGMERDHLSRTIVLAIQFAGDIERFSSDAARMATAAVVSDLEHLAEGDAVPPETKRRLRDICRDLMAAVSANVVANYATRGLDAATEVTIKAITGAN